MSWAIATGSPELHDERSEAKEGDLVSKSILGWTGQFDN
jgi:hypothetical protein